MVDYSVAIGIDGKWRQYSVSEDEWREIHNRFEPTHDTEEPTIARRDASPLPPEGGGRGDCPECKHLNPLGLLNGYVNGYGCTNPMGCCVTEKHEKFEPRPRVG